MTTVFDYLTSGIDYSLPGNGGPDCLYYISVPRRIGEAIFAISTSSLAFVVGKKWLRAPAKVEENHDQHYTPMRLFLLVAMTFAYAMEVAYKLATKQFIFVINPCHMLCVIQILLLALPCHSRFATYLFRVHLFYLHGPFNAVLFPVTNTLFLPGEVFTYWFEHALLLTIPIYLLRHGGPSCTIEPRGDVAWALVSYGLWGLFHFVVLEMTAIFSLANLNSMLCPAISDPFYGPNWRMWAIFHQFILNLASGKLFSLLGVTESQAKAKA